LKKTKGIFPFRKIHFEETKTDLPIDIDVNELYDENVSDYGN
jgi:hypothetical protein